MSPGSPGSSAPGGIRAATRQDLPRIAEIRRGVRENRLTDPAKVTDAEVLWYLDHAIFLVGEAADGSGAVEGFLCANHQTGLVWALFVDPAAEGRGRGSALLEAGLDRLRIAGHRQAHLTTGAGTRALAFYLRRGFRDLGQALDGHRALLKSLDPVEEAPPSTVR